VCVCVCVHLCVCARAHARVCPRHSRQHITFHRRQLRCVNLRLGQLRCEGSARRAPVSAEVEHNSLAGQGFRCRHGFACFGFERCRCQSIVRCSCWRGIFGIFGPSVRHGACERVAWRARRTRVVSKNVRMRKRERGRVARLRLHLC
jgi:hypothetical protein